MSAAIHAFPLARRVHDIELVAGNMAGKSHDAAERYFSGFKTRAMKALLSQGLTVEQAAAQIRDFETAVRCAVWRRVLLGGGAA